MRAPTPFHIRRVTMRTRNALPLYILSCPPCGMGIGKQILLRQKFLKIKNALSRIREKTRLMISSCLLLSLRKSLKVRSYLFVQFNPLLIL